MKIIFAQNIEIVEAISVMPKVMWQLALVYLFQWYALFCYWQNSSKSIALSVYNATPENKAMYEKAVSLAGLVNGWYNVVTFLSAFALVGFAKKYSPKWVHFVCLALAGIGFIVFPHIENKTLLVLCHHRVWNWLGQHDGHTLPDGGESNTERKIWGLHGYYQYDDSDTHVPPNDNIRIYSETFSKQ